MAGIMLATFPWSVTGMFLIHHPSGEVVVDIPLNAPYNWHDIVLAYASVRTMERLVRRLSTKYDTPLHIRTVRRDFQIVRQFWRDRINEGTFTDYAKKCVISPKDVEKFMVPRKKLMTYGSNRPKE